MEHKIGEYWANSEIFSDYYWKIYPWTSLGKHCQTETLTILIWYYNFKRTILNSSTVGIACILSCSPWLPKLEKLYKLEISYQTCISASKKSKSTKLCKKKSRNWLLKNHNAWTEPLEVIIYTMSRLIIFIFFILNWLGLTSKQHSEHWHSPLHTTRFTSKINLISLSNQFYQQNPWSTMDACNYRMTINWKVTDQFWNITTEINQPQFNLKLQPTKCNILFTSIIKKRTWIRIALRFPNLSLSDIRKQNFLKYEVLRALAF